MAIRQIRTIGDPILNKKCKEVKEVSERTKQLIDDMFETMYDANGVGLAAPQIGVLKRIVVIETDEENSYVLINPVILEMDGEQVGKTGIVKRPNHVKVKAFDENMQEFELEGEGLLARAICHECEHLEGELYVDKVSGELKDVSELEDEEEYIEAEA